MVGTRGFCPTRQEKQILCTHDTYLISSVSGTLVYGSMALTLLLSSTGCGNRNKKKRIKASFLALTFQNYIHVKSSNYFWKSSILLQLPGVNPTTLKSIINISPGFALNSSEICQKAKEKKKEKEDRKILPLAMNKWRKKKKKKEIIKKWRLTSSYLKRCTFPLIFQPSHVLSDQNS